MSYERTDASERVVGISVAILAGLVVASILTSSWFYYAKFHDAAPSGDRARSFTHGPEEKLGIVADYAAVQQRAFEHLRGYGWVDAKAGIARIPINRAMELTAQGVKPAPIAKPPGQVP